MKVFVYGTLKDAYGNSYILKDAECNLLGRDVVYGYKLAYSSRPGSFPVAIPSENSEGIVGEIWDITPNPSVLVRLDALEGVSHGMYKREVVVTDGKKTAYMYTGGSKFWDFSEMISVPKRDESNLYEWSR